MKNTPSLHRTDSPSKVIGSIVDSGGLHPSSLTGTFVEDTNTQEAPDDITECLHDLIHNRLFMSTFALAWGKWSEALGSWNPAEPANTGQNKVKSEYSVLGHLQSFLPVYCCSWQSIMTSRKNHPQRYAIFQTPANRFFHQSPNLPLAGAGHVPSLWCDSMIVV